MAYERCYPAFHASTRRVYLDTRLEIAQRIRRSVCGVHQEGCSMAQRMTFEEWLRKVDALCIQKTGLGVDDGVDWPSRDTYDDGGSVTAGYRMWRRWQNEG